MSMLVQMGPPGSEGASMRGIGGATPAPQELEQIQLKQQQAAQNEPVEEEAIVMKADIAVMKRFNSLRDLAPDSPAVTLVQDTIVLCIDLFKLSMASMLAVFVPQLCPASDAIYQNSNSDRGTTAGDFVGPAVASFQPRSDGCSSNPVDHDCTFDENFICLSRLNQFVLSWNFISLGILVFHYFLVWRREHFLIQNFKETLTLGRLHVRDIINDYPGIKARLKKYNRWVFNTSVLAIFIQAVNIISSAVLLFGYYNDGYKTFTTYFTNLLLISLVLYNCVTAAYTGLKHELALSCVAFEPVSYNSINSNTIKGR